TLRVRATDKAGNSAEDSLNLTVYDVKEDFLRKVYGDRFYKLEPVGYVLDENGYLKPEYRNITFEDFVTEFVSPEEMDRLIQLQNYKPGRVNVIIAEADGLNLTRDRDFADYMHKAAENLSDWDLRAFVLQPEKDWELVDLGVYRDASGTIRMLMKKVPAADKGDLALGVYRRFNSSDPELFLSLVGTWGSWYRMKTREGANPGEVEELAAGYLRLWDETRRELNRSLPFTAAHYLTAPYAVLNPLSGSEVDMAVVAVETASPESLNYSKKARELLRRFYHNVTWNGKVYDFLDEQKAPFLINNKIEPPSYGGTGEPYGRIWVADPDALNETHPHDDYLSALRKMTTDPGLLRPEVAENLSGYLDHPDLLHGYCVEMAQAEAALARSIALPSVVVGLPNINHAEAYTYDGRRFVLPDYGIQTDIMWIPDYYAVPPWTLTSIEWRNGIPVREVPFSAEIPLSLLSGKPANFKAPVGDYLYPGKP
ncbi:MAG: hypothetical protein GXO63_00775, partial [Candidatus Micrarchaeota archaeon]|nr:hypothetical protein [Candidatus Micrarchaeota archaeon]